MQVEPRDAATHDDPVQRLVSTGEAARQLGVSIRSLQHWAAEGRVAPDLVTPGGHMRWDVDRLRAELRPNAD